MEEKNDFMTPDEFEQAMKAIAKRYEDDEYDEELCHYYMDCLMRDTLDKLGYTAGIDIFINTPKWYA